jgi:carboxypeptidase family protein
LTYYTKVSQRASVLGLFALLAACSPNPNGQGVTDFNSVQGRVVEAKNPSQAIQQFTVTVGGQSVSVSPAAQGAFKVDRVPTGTQNLTIYAVGYQTVTIPVVVVKDQPTNIDQPIGLVSNTGL